MDKTAKQKAMELLKPPFRLKHGYIFDSAERTNTVADDGDCELGTMARLRGWGRLCYLEDGEEIQDAIGEIIADALNQYFANNAQVASAPDGWNAFGLYKDTRQMTLANLRKHFEGIQREDGAQPCDLEMEHGEYTFTPIQKQWKYFVAGSSAISSSTLTTKE